jgi:hypothetical protein
MEVSGPLRGYPESSLGGPRHSASFRGGRGLRRAPLARQLRRLLAMGIFLGVPLKLSLICQAVKSVTSIIKRRWFRRITTVAFLIVIVNTLLSIRIRNGIRSLVADPINAADSEVFRWVGPSTRAAIHSVTQEDYKISVRPFDWFGESLSVTHTAFLTAQDKKIGIRVRAIPFRGGFDIVGYYTVQ